MLTIKIGKNVEEDFCSVGYDPDYSETIPTSLYLATYFESERPEWCPLVETKITKYECEVEEKI